MEQMEQKKIEKIFCLYRFPIPQYKLKLYFAFKITNFFLLQETRGSHIQCDVDFIGFNVYLNKMTITTVISV